MTAVTAEDETIVQVEAVYQEPEEAAEEAAEVRRRRRPLARNRRRRGEPVDQIGTGPRDSQPDAKYEQKKTGVGQPSDPRPLASRQPCLAASGLHRDAPGTVTTHGHHLLYPQRSWS